MHSCEFVGFDPAILQKPNEDFPSCWTVVKWPDLTCSVYRIEIHSDAKLNFKPFCVTHKLVATWTDDHRKARLSSIGSHENNGPSKLVKCSGILGRTR